MKYARIEFLYDRDTVWPNFRIKNLCPELAKLWVETHQICLTFSDKLFEELSRSENPHYHIIKLRNVKASYDHLHFSNIYEYNNNQELINEVASQIKEIINSIEPEVIEVIDNAYEIWEKLKLEFPDIRFILFLAMYNFTFKHLSQTLWVNYEWMINQFSNSLNKYDDIWALSRYFWDYARSECSIPSTRDIKVRYNWIHPEKFSGTWQKYTELEEKFWRYKYTIWTLSRVDPEKGIHNLITTLPYLKRELGDNFKLLVAWDSVFYPEYINILKYIAKQQDVLEQIEFLWYLWNQDKADFLQFIDLYVFPTICPESWAITILETLWSWTPCLVSNYWVWPEYMNDTVWDDFDPYDTKLLWKKIVKSLKWEHSEKDIRELAKNKYSRASAAKQTLNNLEN